mgnify:CR=1 FL=1
MPHASLPEDINALKQLVIEQRALLASLWQERASSAEPDVIPALELKDRIRVVGTRDPISSDYDLTLKGQGAEKVAAAFYDVWAESFGTLAPSAVFDNNIYSEDVFFRFDLSNRSDLKFVECLLRSIDGRFRPSWRRTSSGSNRSPG